ncbi:hypothetical protein ACH5RR_013988 [Cinchona calisaya]|uniref:Uncharacterized protein n=1 Tax=Cinchona calisaya TaxID=153742 RepID=A0ABD3A1M4_9GENT
MELYIHPSNLSQNHTHPTTQLTSPVHPHFLHPSPSKSTSKSPEFQSPTPKSQNLGCCSSRLQTTPAKQPSNAAQRACREEKKLNNADKTWTDEYLLEAKQALGYPLEPSDSFGDDNPAKHFDTLLYLAFSRYLKESPSPMRERVYALIGKRFLPKWIKAASLQNLIFPYDNMDRLTRKERNRQSAVFWALFDAIYLCFGMPEVYCALFEVFRIDPEAENCQPKLRRQLEDVDYVSVEFKRQKTKLARCCCI